MTNSTDPTPTPPPQPDHELYPHSTTPPPQHSWNNMTDQEIINHIIEQEGGCTGSCHVCPLTGGPCKSDKDSLIKASQWPNEHPAPTGPDYRTSEHHGVDVAGAGQPRQLKQLKQIEPFHEAKFTWSSTPQSLEDKINELVDAVNELREQDNG